MTELNRRERYMLASAFRLRMDRLEKSGDFPEKALEEKFYKKVIAWVYDGKGDITSDEGVGE